MSREHLHRLPLRAVIAHPTVAGRLALRMLLDSEEGIEVVGHAPDAGDAGRLAREHGAAFLVVHEALLRHLAGPRSLATRLVVLGMERHPEAAAAAIRDGASAYVQWDRADEELATTLRRLAAQPVLSSEG